MKAILFAGAALFVTVAGARAAEEYPTPIARPIMSSVPVQDVGGGGPWSKTTVVTGSGGYAGGVGAESMPVAQLRAPAAPAAVVQHGTLATHG